MTHTTTPTFLEEVIKDLRQQHTIAVFTDYTLVVPTQQAVTDLQTIIHRQLGNISPLPTLITLEDWMIQLSNLKIVSNLELLALLYQTLQQHHTSQESFERFYGWGELLLQDFNMIDKCLVNTDALFTTLLAQKTITLNYEHLSELQTEAIRSFWKSFDKRLSTPQEEFLRLWEALSQVYKHFTHTLLEKGIGYAGLCYKQLHHTLSPSLLRGHRKVAFIGFNALYLAEEQFLAWLTQQLPTQFYWDTDAYYMNDTLQEAGHHLRAHLKKKHFQTSFKTPFPTRIQEVDHQIRLFECSTVSAQAELISTQIEQLVTKKHDPKIAIILADDTLYLPMLYALPTHLQSVHASIGYPLSHTATYQLIEQLLLLQSIIHLPTCPPGHLPLHEVMDLLKHPFVGTQDPILTTYLLQIATNPTTHHLPINTLPLHSDLLQLIFGQISTAPPLQYIIEVLHGIKSTFNTIDNSLPPIEQTAIDTLLTQLTYTQKSIFHLLPPAVADLLPLLKQLIRNLSLSPLDDPAAPTTGIHLLKLEETACLDFDYVFILGMNEGSLPSKTTQGSLIPYNLRKGYGLPTIDLFYAATDAYYFYRLLQRAKQVNITYLAGGSRVQEKSRYLWQLLYESNLPIEQHSLSNANIIPLTIQPIVIPKTVPILNKLADFTTTPGQTKNTLTPSALNTYISCSLKFYFRYLLKIQPPIQPLIEAPESVRFGSLLHQVMDNLYAPLCNPDESKMVTIDDLKQLKSKVEGTVYNVFRSALYPHQELQWNGQHLIEQEVMTKVVHQLITIDQQRAPFRLIGVEVGKKTPLMALFSLKDGKEVPLRGIIDRIHQQQDILHLLDYKTGSITTHIGKIGDLFDNHGAQAIFQIFLYAWIYKQTFPAHARYKIQPHLIRTRQLFDPTLTTHITINSTTDKEIITDIENYQSAFENGLRELLEELFDPQVPFVQTEDLQTCTSCPYQRICQR